METEHSDLEKTDPNFKPLSPDETQQVTPPVKGDPDLNPMFDRVRKEDESFKQTVKQALRSRFAGKKVSILDFEHVEEKDGQDEFKFTVKIGGEGRKILVEKRKEQTQH